MIWDVQQARGAPTNVGSNTFRPTLTREDSFSGSVGKSVPAEKSPFFHNDGVHATPKKVVSIRTNGNEPTFEPARMGMNPLPSDTNPLKQMVSSAYTRNEDVRPIQQYGSSEAITSCAWFPDSPSQLVAGMGLKWLRVYDVRADSSSPPGVIFATKAIYGISVDPFHPYRFASHTEDGIVKIWDIRKPTEAVLTINGSTRSAGLSNMAFSPRRSGLLATLGKESNYVRIWDIQEGTTKVYTSSTLYPNRSSAGYGVNGNFADTNSMLLSGGSSYMTGNALNTSRVPLPGDMINTGNVIKSAAVGGTSNVMGSGTTVGVGGIGNVSDKLASVQSSSASIGYSNPEDECDVPVLWKCRQTKLFSRPLASFTWVPYSSNSSTYHLLSVNKDSLIENVTIQESFKIAWKPSGNLLIAGNKNISQVETEVENTMDNSHKETPNMDNGKEMKSSDALGRFMAQLALDSNIGGKKLFKSAKSTLQISSESSGTSDLQFDISVIMKNRAIKGYSMNTSDNLPIITESRPLKELWEWLLQAEELTAAGKAKIGNYDFSFQGIQTVLEDIRALSPKRRSQLTARSSTASTNSANNYLPASTSTESDEIYMASSSRTLQRKLALVMCGWGFTRSELDKVLSNLELNGEFEKAAGWALFHADFTKAIRILSNSKDERLKLISTALAGHSNKEGRSSTIWQDLCRTLSLELSDPYLRAIFGYISSGDWKVVLEHEELPLRDRLGVAIRFLNDDELVGYVDSTVSKMLVTGDVEGLILTGLTSQGADLMEQYVNNTGDIQTASLVMSYCVPRRFKDQRVHEWTENYRLLLDRWQLYHIRAHFDIARGKKMGTRSADITPPQVYVRCNFCSQSVAHSSIAPGNRGRDGRRMGVGGISGDSNKRVGSTCCPSCRKPLPRCSLCLLNLGTPMDSTKKSSFGGQPDGNQGNSPTNFGMWFTWCQKCRHGGHASHIL
ncbi:hypothetical protein K493DRAFT_339376, partial [Basidiobolus meristosporus CBS 931.73]